MGSAQALSGSVKLTRLPYSDPFVEVSSGGDENFWMVGRPIHLSPRI